MSKNKGWECPKCGKVWAPWKESCESCVGRALDAPYVVPTPWPTYPPSISPWPHLPDPLRPPYIWSVGWYDSTNAVGDE